MQRYKTKDGQTLIHESYDKLLDNWNVAYEQQNIMTSYGSTHIVTAGQSTNPTLLLFHGVGDNSAMM